RGLDVTAHDATAGPAALDELEIDARLRGDLPGERRGLHAPAVTARLRNRRRSDGVLHAPATRRFRTRARRRLACRRILALRLRRHRRRSVGHAGLGTARRLRLTRRRRRRARTGLRDDRADVVVLLGDDADQRAHRRLVAGRHEDLAQHTGAERLHLDVGLVRLHFGEDVSALDAVAFLLEPLDDLAALHLL